MKFEENHICQVTENIWKASLRMDVQRSAREPAPNGGTQTLAACVHITGGWVGAVYLHCSLTLARQAAAVMFGVSSSEITLDQTEDALGELVNMTGGNIKALLPPPCSVSLPTVADGTDYRMKIPGSRLVCQVPFECRGEMLVVRILEQDENHLRDRNGG